MQPVFDSSCVPVSGSSGAVYSLIVFRPNAPRSVWARINLHGIEKVDLIGGSLMLFADFGPETIMPIASVIAALLGVVVIIWPAWRICSRAGFPGALGLLIVVPLLNLVLLYVLAFAEWPALRNQKRSTNLDV